MNELSLHQFLTIYSWFPFAGLMLFLLLIARFYQKFSQKRMFFWWYLAPMGLFGVATIRFATLEVGQNDLINDVAWGLTGIILLILLSVMYYHMLYKK